jgi:hypothetical protein
MMEDTKNTVRSLDRRRRWDSKQEGSVVHPTVPVDEIHRWQEHVADLLLS